LKESGSTVALQEKLEVPGSSEKDKDMDPIESFVRLEYYNIVVFMQSLHKTLGGISKVIRGLISPSEELKTLAETLMRREVLFRPLYSDDVGM
jgi:hypothetical protein